MPAPGQRAPAWVSGGSSGIGLEIGRLLAAQGRPVVLMARNGARLEAAAADIRSGVSGAEVLCIPVDVSDRDAVAAAAAQAVAAHGAPGCVVASAGIVEPGLFLEQPLESFERQMAVNYHGSLYLLHAAAPLMRDAGGGQIGLIASAAAFFGIYGYAAYAPTKYAVRALAEVLRVELAPDNITVTLCYPPDTDTPQLAAERLTKPEATSVITGGGGLWQPGAVAARLVRGMEKGHFAVTPGWQVTLLNLIAPLIAPILRWHQGRVIRTFAK
ncbi:SDR family oxidoreductase [Pseudooceanicola sp.]|jgi:3-dehydrosphinganine reductase|uniref:SDR family oxidoreductase n=1 Tax=Pseudooceanicola TaxID=1679449 RepID=UPI003512874C